MKSMTLKAVKMTGWTSGLLLLAISAQAQFFVPGVLKREFFPNATAEQLISTNPPAPTATNFYSAWNVTDDTQNYGARYSGLIVPSVTGAYDFYLASDDDSYLFLSTNDSSTNKFQIAHENQWSALLNWNTPGNVAGIASQKNSATWTNAAGVAPYASGIILTQGVRYYMEVDHRGGGGGNRMAVTVVPHGFGVGDTTDTVLTNGSPDFTIGVVIPNPSVLLFQAAGNPVSRTNFIGTPATFRAAPSFNSQIPPRYQWQRGTVSGGTTNWTDINGATNGALSATSFYTIVASTNDNGARFRCIAYSPGLGNPFLVRTSGVAVLTVPASGGLAVPGRLRRDLFTGLTQPVASHFLTNVIEIGNVGPANAVNTFTSFEVPSAGANYGERVSGFFTPTNTGNFVFFLTSDDESRLYVSTNDQPSGKLLVAQEDGVSNPRDWYGGTSGNGSIPSQKRSDQWMPDPFNPPPGGAPYATGIPMVAGNRYYIEATHWGSTPANHLGATYGTVEEVAMGIPAPDEPSRFTNDVISYVTRPVNSFAITSQPADFTRFEGLPYSLRVTVTTDSEVTPAYQWRKNGVPIPGQTASNYTAIAIVPDNGATFSVDIVIPGVISTNTTNATLTVIQGTFAEGILRREFWTNSSARGITRQIVGANAGGFPDPDYELFIDTLEIDENRGDNYVQRVSGFFVPPETDAYVFFVACDDDTDLYISTDQQPANKYLIAQETAWSNVRQWLTANGGGNAAQKRSDQFNGGQFAAGIQLTQGQRYYIEMVHRENTGGDRVSATFKRISDVDPPDGTATLFTGSVIGTPVPEATQLGITLQPVNANVYQLQPAYFSAFSTNDSIVPSTYQWRRSDGLGGRTNIPGGTASSFGFVTSLSDSGAQFDCVVRAPGTSLVLTTAVAMLTVQPGGTFVPNLLARETWNVGVGPRIIEAGGLGPADTNDTVNMIDFGPLAASYATRIRGYFVPQETTNYVFFICSDDNADLFLSTDDQPVNKRLIAQEQGFSSGRLWLGATSGNPALKRSDTWTPDGGLTMPYSAGIWMTNGQRYYIEAVHSQAGGDDNFGVTFKLGIDPANDPLDGTPSVLTNGVIGYLEAPAVGNQPTLTISKSGNSINVSWTPAGGTLLSKTNLASLSWDTVGTANPTVLPIQPGNLYLRVSVP
jgi:hypothetical protein